MKKVLIVIGGISAMVLYAVIIVILFDERDESVIKNYVRNENLPTVKADWQGTPVDEKGRFANYEHAFLPKISDLLKWQLNGNPQKAEKEADKTRLAVFDPTEFLQNERSGILWLGHAGFFIRIGGANIIVDAVFGKPPLVKTFVDVPSPIDKIRRVDYILISHDHRDHADEATVKQLTQKFPDAKILAGLGMEDLLGDWKTPTNDLQTAGWFQQFALPDEKLKIFFLPTRHWARRGLFDTNKRLWGAFIIQAEDKTIYFGSDSGYGSHYKDLAALFPKIDVAILGIGAYSPRWFMKPNHSSPEDALQAFVDSKAALMIPMHFGRFDLSDEPPGEPLSLLKDAAEKDKLTDKIKVLQINESLVFSGKR
ncbi:MAG: MBL fold metallo-hydrolase [Acidobacteriota bacterium]|nr:MBL fold metallo-hydrolase [Acidobacteriota bacterium]